MSTIQKVFASFLLMTTLASCGMPSEQLQSSIQSNKAPVSNARQQKMDTMTVYFSSKAELEKAGNCGAVVAVSEPVIDASNPQRALMRLLKGPAADQKDVTSFFSAQTSGLLKSVKVNGDTVYVDFKDMRKLIPNASSSCGSDALLSQLDTTLKVFPNIKKTIYAIEGNPKTFYEWLQIGCNKDNNNCDASAFKSPVNTNTNKSGGICVNKCGDNKCQAVVCTGSGCPCPESVKSCAVDCKA